MSDPIEVVRQQLEAKGCNPRQRGEDYSAKCPAHEDRSPSLSVATGDGGKVLLHCFAGCSHVDIVAALELRQSDLFPPETKLAGETKRLVATYTYELADGTPTIQVQRYEPKDFRQRHWDGQRWQWGAGDAPKVLFRLPHVLRAIAEGADVWVVEGEKDVLAIEATDPHIVATCSLAGAGKWSPDDATTLRGAKVVHVIADSDSPGRRHAKDVVKSLIGHVGEVQVWEAPGDAKDAADHLAAGHDLDDLVLVWADDEGAQSLYGDLDGEDYQDHAADGTHSTRLMTTAQLLARKPPPMLIDGWLSVGATGLIQGPSGVGKSFIAIDMALSVASGQRWLQTYDVVAPGPVLYVMGEGGWGMGSRIDAWGEDRGLEVPGLPVWWLDDAVNLSDPGSVAVLLTEMAQMGVEPRLVIFDTLARCAVGADENSASDMGTVMEQVTHVGKETGAAVLALHHTGKDASRGARGSSAIKGAIDTAIEVTGDSLRMEMRAEKQRDMAPGATTILRLEEVGWSAVPRVYDPGTRDEPVRMNALDMEIWASFLKAGRPITRAEWVSRCAETASRAAVHRVATRMIESQRVSEIKDGSTTLLALIPQGEA